MTATDTGSGAVSPEVLALLRVALAYASPDDWDVPSIYVSMLRELALALAAGDSADALVAHAEHTGCDAAECALRIPHYMSREGMIR